MKLTTFFKYRSHQLGKYLLKKKKEKKEEANIQKFLPILQFKLVLFSFIEHSILDIFTEEKFIVQLPSLYSLLSNYRSENKRRRK